MISKKITKRKCLIVLIILFFAGDVLGQVQTKAAGKLLIPSAGDSKEYKGVITFTLKGVEIECSEKIFQPFNEFNTPKKRKLIVTTAELYEIWVLKNYVVHLFPRRSLFKQYRNLFSDVIRSISMAYWEVKEEALLFVLDDPAGIDGQGKKLIKFLNRRIRAIIKRDDKRSMESFKK